MSRWTSVPIRRRLTFMFAASMGLVILGVSVFVYVRTGFDLLDTVDAGLRSRAELLATDVQRRGPALVNVEQPLIETDEVFAQIADSSGRIIQSTRSVSRWRLLSPAQIRSVRRPTVYDRRIPGVDYITRVLAVPAVTARGRLVVMVGVSLQDREDELIQLGVTLAIGGTLALALISSAAWLALAGALRPVERMRREAAAISATDPQRRLTRPAGTDEIAMLGATLNQMLDRIGESVDRERRLIDRASHELRTPLAIQRMDLDLALSGPQTRRELTAALLSVSEENAHLIRLAEDLLVLSRVRGGELGVHRVDSSLRDLLDDARRRNGVLAGACIPVSYRAADERALLDPVWFRQAIDNLIDNAVRHTPGGGQIDVRASRQDGVVTLVVEDTGPGFPEAFIGRAFEPFASAAPPGRGQHRSAGLGLAVVRCIAEAHGGHAWAENRPAGGARVTVTFEAG